MDVDSSKPLTRFSTLVRYVTPYKGVLFLALLLMLGESAASLATPWLAGKFVGGLLENKDPLEFIPLQSLLIVWLLVLAAQALLRFGNRYLIGNTSEKMLTKLRTRLYDHLQSLPLGFYQGQKRGEVLTLLTNDASVVSNFVTGTLIGLLPHLVTLAGALLMMFMIDPFIALIAAAIVPFFYLMMKILGRKIRPISRAMVEEYAHTFSIVEENLGILPLIKSCTREATESGRFKRGNLRLLELTSRYLRIQSLLSPVVQFLAAGAVLLLLWFGVGQLQSGLMTPADLVSLLLYGMLLTRPMSSLADVYGQVQYTRGATERLANAFAVEPEPEDKGKKVLPPIKGDIEFRRVKFHYPGRERILNGLDLKINAGDTIAITGENGVGKSTLSGMLMRFIAPQKGQVLIDGTDIRKVTLNSLRRQIGLVQQQVLLLNGTIRENISFGGPDASEQEIKEAARAAHALDFILKLPNGFNTIIGDQGIKLSGGQ